MTKLTDEQFEEIYKLVDQFARDYGASAYDDFIKKTTNEAIDELIEEAQENRERIIHEIDADPYYSQLIEFLKETVFDELESEMIEEGIISGETVLERIASVQAFCRYRIYEVVGEYLNELQKR